MRDLLNKFIARFFSNEESVYFGFLLFSSFIFLLLFGDILFPVFLSIVIAFLLNGLLRTFKSLKFSHRVSLSLTLIIFFGLYLGIFLTLPSIGAQINSLLQKLPVIVVAFQNTLSGLSETYGDIISKEDIIAKKIELETTYTNKEYQRKRAIEYPSMADQLDDIYHNRIDEWKKVIKATKDKYPK